MGFDLLTEVAPARPATGDLPSAGPTYRAAAFKDGAPSLEGVTTLLEVFDRSVERYPTADCLGCRPVADGKAGDYVWWTYKDTSKKVAAVGSALKELGIAAGAKVGVFGANCPEWMLAMQACNRMSYTCVPLYDSLGEDAVEYIVQHSGASAVFVSQKKFAKLADALAKLKGQVKVVVYWGESDEACVKAAEAAKASVHSLEDLMKLGENKPCDAVPPKPDDLSTIMYTSGTTGQPKGVMLTHKSVTAQVVSLATYLGQFGKWGPGDIFLSYLPLAHIFDRTAEELFLHLGGAIGYWRGDIAGLVDDMAALQPTMFVGVPRVFDRIYARVTSQVASSSFLKKFLFNYAFKRKLHFLDQGIKAEEATPLLDCLIFNKIKDRLGGKVKLIVTGGAPIALHTENFLRVCFCCPVVQGYGLTETCAGSFIAIPDAKGMCGTVGPPQPVCSFRLESVPEMNYDACGPEPKGEVCIKGESNFSGYYKDDKQTNEVLEKDGWFHTGDIGTIVGDGVLKLIDRKKNIFKLSQGEYIAVEMVEGVYKKNPMVEQLWVYGNSFKSCLVAVVVPVKDKLMAWASQHGVQGTFEEVCRNSDACDHVLEVLNLTATEAALKGFEKIKAVYLDAVLFSVENDCLTPTFKLKRPQLLRKYEKEIEALYSSLG
ncbi:unnamed protein product [Ostreobium quekettii]|uniref:Long-chain-fatty-acid--CoA ligase n=1 Tax=Ostreobium quekettii TaxID=121088 RepID=A0A8S1J3R0_9CHLO|nr:unnamed protein product [Ostreobium quekettii]|eukprot:evm.model.scf_619EXC.3 EVM.evm.TU.scf_619EXC.3   scf_619EXC:21635-27032(-)